jgi:hypothetical protein
MNKVIGGNYNMDFTMNENFIQVMEKLKEELQIHVEFKTMPQC